MFILLDARRRRRRRRRMYSVFLDRCRHVGRVRAVNRKTISARKKHKTRGRGRPRGPRGKNVRERSDDATREKNVSSVSLRTVVDVYTYKTRFVRFLFGRKTKRFSPTRRPRDICTHYCRVTRGRDFNVFPGGGEAGLDRRSSRRELYPSRRFARRIRRGGRAPSNRILSACLS